MAENTTTYTAVIDTQVKGADEIEQLGEKADGAAAGFTKLQLQIRQTQKDLQAAAASGDKVKFNKLKAQLDDLEEGLEKVQFQAKQFDDQLASLPGPAGAAGNALKSVDGAFKLLVANPIIATIGVIVGLFLALKESLNRTEEGQAKLNKISEAFTKIMNGVFAVIEPVAMMLADLVVGLLENDKVMKVLSVTMGVLSGTFTAVLGIGKELVGFIINNFVNAFKTLVGVAGGAGKVLKGVFTFDLDLIKEGISQVGDTVTTGFNSFVDNAKSTAKGIGTAVVNGVTTGFEAGSKAFTAGSKRLTEEEKKAAEEAKKKREEAAKKAAEEAKKQAEEDAKNLAAANKVQTEAYLATLAARDQEIFKAGVAQNERLLALDKAGIKDKTAVLEQGRLEELAINKKYDDEEAKKIEEAKKKKEEDDKKAAEDIKTAEDKTREDNLLGLEAQLEFDFLTFQQRKDLISQKEAELLTDKTLTENQRTAIAKAAAAERASIDQAELQAKTDIQKSQLDLVQGFGSLLTQIAGKNKALAIAGIVLEQGAALGKVLIDTFRGISAATAAAAPFIANPITAIPATANLVRTLAQIKITGALSAAGIIAGAAKGISAINKSGIPGGGGGASAGGGGGDIAIPAPTVQAAGAPQIQGTAAATPGSQIASTLAAASGKPIKAYVVSTEISSQTALDRRTSNAATFGG
jgi:hypothetical protein